MHRLLPIVTLLAVGLACDANVMDDSGWGDTGLDGPKDNIVRDPEDTGAPVGSPTNNPPNAYAGPDRRGGIFPGDTIILDGSTSSDLDGDPLTFFWEIVGKPVGSMAALADFQSPTAQLWVDLTGEYEVQLTVTDPGGLKASDRAKITVESGNQAPEADIYGPSSTFVGDLVTLSAADSVDPDGDDLEYHWSFRAPPGSVSSLEGARIPQAAERPYFTPDVAGTYEVELKVYDGELWSKAKRLLITAQTRQTGNSGGSVGSSSSSSGCLDCAASATAVASATWTSGDVASSFGLVILPIFVALWHRRRDD